MWDFLDVMDKNLLYTYADYISGKNQRLHVNSKDDSEAKQEENRKQVGLYLIWFTYRYILQCETLEETIPYQNEDILREYKLNNFFLRPAIFLCNGEICFRKPEDISMILEILYNRYDLWEQFDCFIRGTSGVRRKRCIEAKNKYQEMYRKIRIKFAGENDETDEEYLKNMFTETGTVI